jgi:hypothetical protein
MNNSTVFTFLWQESTVKSRKPGTEGYTGLSSPPKNILYNQEKQGRIVCPKKLRG